VTVPVVVLAAGAASRFGSPKQLLLLPHVLERLRNCPLGPVVAVEGAYPLEGLRLEGVTVVRCPDWERGPGASLRCGLAALAADAPGALVVLADGPNLDPRSVDRILAHRRDADVVAASYGGVRGHPAYLARSAWTNVPDGGMRVLHATLIPCDDLDEPGDVDTRDAWR